MFVCVCVLYCRLTIAPDDTTSIIIHELATNTRQSVMPVKSERVKILCQKPGAAALSFYRLQHIIIRYVFGWDSARRRPIKHLIREQQTGHFQPGGLLGITKAFVIANESQARGSLHMHCLVWTAGNYNMIHRCKLLAQAISNDDHNNNAGSPPPDATQPPAAGPAINPVTSPVTGPATGHTTGQHATHHGPSTGHHILNRSSGSASDRGSDRGSDRSSDRGSDRGSGSCSGGGSSSDRGDSDSKSMAGLPIDASSAVMNVNPISIEERVACFLDSSITCELSTSESVLVQMNECRFCGNDLIQPNDKTLQTLRYVCQSNTFRYFAVGR